MDFSTLSIIRYYNDIRELNVLERVPVSETLCSLEYRTMDKYEYLVIRSVIHRYQNHLESQSM
jgi:hypothetical protein